jgi:hypothetical protein
MSLSSGISLQDLIAETAMNAAKTGNAAVGTNTNIGGAPPTSPVNTPVTPPVASVGGGAPVDIASLMASATATIAQVQDRTQPLIEGARAATQNAEDLNSMLKLSMDSKTAAATQIAKIKATTDKTAAQINSTPTNTFKKLMTSPEAAANREALNNKLITAQATYDDVMTRMSKGNLFSKAFIQVSELPRATDGLRQAQENLRFGQNTAARATQNYLSSVNASRAIAGNMSADDAASAEEQFNIANIMIEGIVAEKSISTESARNYAIQLNVEESALGIAVKEIQLADAAGRLNASTQANILQDMQVSSAKTRIDRERAQYASRDKYLAYRDSQMAEMFRIDGREEDIGNIGWETGIESNMNATTNPLFARYIQFQNARGFTGDAYAEAYLSSMSGKSMGTVQQNVLNAGQTMGKNYNDGIKAQMNKAGITQQEKEALQSQLLDINSESSVVAISKLYNTVKVTAVNDATEAISTGTMIVPDMKSVLNSTDPAYEKFNSEIPQELRAFMTEGEFKDIDFTISGKDVGGKVNGIVQQMLDGIARTTSSAVAASPDVDQTAVERATVRKAAKAISAYYKGAREYSARASGMDNLRTLRVQGVDDLGATSWFSGIQDSKALNLESSDELESLMLDGLRARKAKRIKQTATSLTDNVRTR